MRTRRELTPQEQAAAQRLKALYESAKAKTGLSQMTLAHACGWNTQAAVSQYLLGKIALNADALVKFARFFDVAPEDIYPELARSLGLGASPQPASAEVYAMIPQYTTRGGCGSGYYNDHVEVSGGMAFKRDWLARKGLDEQRACVIYADGDSMQPTIGDGDVLLLDQRDTTPANGQVYAVLVDEEVLVKRVQRAFGMVTLKSDNPDKTRFPDIMVPANAELYVIGKVVWRGGGL